MQIIHQKISRFLPIIAIGLLSLLSYSSHALSVNKARNCAPSSLYWRQTQQLFSRQHSLQYNDKQQCSNERNKSSISLLHNTSNTVKPQTTTTALSLDITSASVEQVYNGATLVSSTYKLFVRPDRYEPQPILEHTSKHDKDSKLRIFDFTLHRLSSWAFTRADAYQTGQLTIGQVYGGVLALYWQMTRFAGGLIRPFLGPPPDPARVTKWCKQASFSNNNLLGRTEFRRVVARSVLGHSGSHIVVTVATVMLLMPLLRKMPILNKILCIPAASSMPISRWNKLGIILWRQTIAIILAHYLVPFFWKPVDKWWGNRLLPRRVIRRGQQQQQYSPLASVSPEQVQQALPFSLDSDQFPQIQQQLQPDESFVIAHDPTVVTTTITVTPEVMED